MLSSNAGPMMTYTMNEIDRYLAKGEMILKMSDVEKVEEAIHQLTIHKRNYLFFTTNPYELSPFPYSLIGRVFTYLKQNDYCVYERKVIGKINSPKSLEGAWLIVSKKN